jgi:hypothetical protein
LKNATHRFLCRDEELRPIRVGAGIRHANGVGLVLLQRRELILKLLAPYAFAASAIAERIATLFRKRTPHTKSVSTKAVREVEKSPFRQISPAK